MPFIRKLSNNKIQRPDVVASTGGNCYLRSDNLPIVRYLMITKVYESQKFYYIRGVRRCTKFYGIGILTTDNQYFYSELHTRHVELTDQPAEIFKRVLLNRYRYTKDTKIVVADNIKRTKEPIGLFIKIMTAAMKIQYHKVSIPQMLITLNYIYHYIKTTKHGFNISKWHKDRMIEELFKHDRFDFMPDPNWVEKLDLVSKQSKHAQIECAIGILYMNIKEYRNNNNRKYLNKKKEKLQEIENNVNKEENI